MIYPEALYHDSNLPNKQNLYCGGRSTWEVILESEDFKNNANLPNDTIHNTDPEFIIIGGERSSLSYVLVMDISKSMDDKQRFIPMKSAAKRWITYDVLDGTKVGLVFFNDLTKVGYNLTEVNDDARKNFNSIIDNEEASGQTCIACGLLQAAIDPGLLNKTPGNVIILITDGKQNCQNCPTIAYATSELVKQKIRVITIALGDEADPEIEDLAEKTGGKSYYVEDNSGAGDFNDAFSGSMTYQPGDTLGNTSITVYQKDWGQFHGESEFKDIFTVDTSIGKDLTFKLEITKNRKELQDCESNFTISLIDPDITGRTDITFKCTRDNFGIFSYKFEGNSKSGRWQFWIKANETIDSMSVKVTSKSKDGESSPIRTRCWINTGSQTLDSGVNLKLAAMAEVKQGNMPVIGAKVIAYVERPQDSGVILPPLELELYDNGAGLLNKHCKIMPLTNVNYLYRC